MNRFIALLVLAAVPVVASCSTINQDNLTEIAKKGQNAREETKKGIAKAVDLYCLNVPFSARLVLRDEVNDYAEEGRIIIECSGDNQESN